MKRRLYVLVTGLLLIPMVLASVTLPTDSVDAQRNQPRNCPQLVRVAEDELVLNCANQPYNSACYGYPKVEARLEDDPDHAIDEDFVPGSWTPLETFSSVHAFGMNVDEAEWGLAGLKLQDDIPRGLVEELPFDPGVLFLLFGDVEIESAVPDELLYIPVEEPLEVTTTESTDVKEEASASSDTLGTVPEGTTFFADGVSPDGLWLRIAFEMKAAWVELSAVGDPDVSDLPEIGEDSLTPMGAFYFRSGAGAAECNQALPDMMFMQVPEDVEADLMVDDLPFRLDSATAVLRIRGNALWFQVINGMLTLYPDSPDEIIIPAGFNYISCELSEPDLFDGWDEEPNDQNVTECEPGLPVPFTNRERQEIQGLERLPDNLFLYEFRIPRVSQASGVGGPIDKVEIPPDSPAYDKIIRNCDLGRIPPAVCQHLTGYTPGG